MLKKMEIADPKSCFNRADDDEKLFVLLGRDPAAPVAIRAWVNERIRLGKNMLKDPQIQEAIEAADHWQVPSPAVTAKSANSADGVRDQDVPARRAGDLCQ